MLPVRARQSSLWDASFRQLSSSGQTPPCDLRTVLLELVIEDGLSGTIFRNWCTWAYSPRNAMKIARFGYRVSERFSTLAHQGGLNQIALPELAPPLDPNPFCRSHSSRVHSGEIRCR